MSRIPRLLVDNACYHVLCRGNNRAEVFHQESDRQRYGQLLLEHFTEQRVALYHYCLMPNHVHFVVCPATGTGLRQAMHQLNLMYAQHLHRHYGHVGHVWQDRFKSLLIADDAYLLQCGVYIELNPVRAGLVAAPSRYAWSSYNAYAHGRRDPLVTPSPTYHALGPTPSARQASYQRLIAHQRWPLPDDGRRRRGRPKKSSDPKIEPRKIEPVLFFTAAAAEK